MVQKTREPVQERERLQISVGNRSFLVIAPESYRSTQDAIRRGTVTEIGGRTLNTSQRERLASEYVRELRATREETESIDSTVSRMVPSRTASRRTAAAEQTVERRFQHQGRRYVALIPRDMAQEMSPGQSFTRVLTDSRVRVFEIVGGQRVSVPPSRRARLFG